MRSRFETAYPNTRNRPEAILVWNMLMDTNLRSAEGSALRDFPYMFRRPPKGRVREFTKAQRIYERICLYVANNNSELVEHYRKSSERPMSLGIEVRKTWFGNATCKLSPIRRPMNPPCASPTDGIKHYNILQEKTAWMHNPGDM